MKKMRRFAAIAAVAAMTACMTVPMMAVMPAGAEGSITISNEAVDHVYEAYQIFDGTLTDGVLTEVVWGAGVTNTDALMTAVKAITLSDSTTPFASCADAAAVAEVLGGEGIATTDAEITKAFAEVVGKYLGAAQGTTSGNTYSISGLDDGYYLVQDKAGSLKDEDDAYTRYIVKVLGTATDIAPKSSTPSVIKKVKEDDKTVTATGQEFAGQTNYNVGEDYNDVADYCIGEAVPFKLYGTMPATLADYDSYYYCFNDTLGSQFNAPAAADVKVYIDGNAVTAGNNMRVDVTGQKITVSFEDIKALGANKDSIVTVEYTAVLNSTANIGQPGQENEVYLTYSNNPNEEYAPETGDTTPDKPSDNGQTPVDKVIVFTYELDVTKVDGTDNTKKLENAVFNLQNEDSEYAVVANGRLTGWTTVKADATPLTTDKDGLIKVAGLDDGVYTLTEVTPPATYNPLEAPLTVTIEAVTANDQAWDFTASKAMTGISVTVDDGAAKEGANGVVNVEVANNKGATLPGTGGIGTTLFYVVGGTLVAGAGVTLIAKKRMKKED